jgi:hypothetical protein
MYLLFDPRMNQFDRTAAVRAGQGFGGAEQAADKRPLVVHRATLRPEMYTVQFIQRGFLLGGRLARQAGHFLRRSGDRTTAIMAARYALERGNLAPQIADFLTVAAHLTDHPNTMQRFCPSWQVHDSSLFS